MHDDLPRCPVSGAPRAPAAPSRSGAPADALPLTAYRLPGTANDAHAIVPAPVGRAWMRATQKQFAHRCLPLLIANQSGWLLLSAHAVEAVWDGGDTEGAVRIGYPDGEPRRPPVTSIFGYGILTWSVDYLFRTPPGYNLLVRGPANLPRDGIQALEGVVEADWAVASFTMNWRFTRVDHPVRFEVGDPFCMVVPQLRHELERFEPGVVPLADDPELAAQWRAFQSQRMLMTGVRKYALRQGGRAALERVPFERHYFEGTSPGGRSATEHQTRLALRPFTARDSRSATGNRPPSETGSRSAAPGGAGPHPDRGA